MARGAHHRTAEGVGSDFSRASPEKIDRLKLSSCQLGEHHYCLVECTKQPTQTGCTGAQAGAGVQCQGVGAQGQRIARLRTPSYQRCDGGKAGV